MPQLRVVSFLFSLCFLLYLSSAPAYAGWWPIGGGAKTCLQFNQLDPDAHLISFSARRKIGDRVVLTSLSGNFYYGTFAGVSESDGNQVIVLTDPSGKATNTYYRNRLSLGQTFAPGEPVTFVTKRGNPYRGIFAGFDESGDIKLRQFEPGKKEQVLTLKRRDIDGQQTRTGAREVVPIPEAKAMRRSQNFGRTPDVAVDASMHSASQLANDSFEDWLSGEGAGADLSFQQEMERMRRLYAGVAGSESDYRHYAKGYANTRGEITREFVKKWHELKALPEGAVALPGIPDAMSPQFSDKIYAYPTLSPEVKKTYYHAMENKLEDYSRLMRQLESLRKSRTTKEAKLAKENEIFDTIVDFGRLASGFRQFEDGNWELYGPMINSMVRRVGFDYNIEYPGYLDLIFQGADPETLKPWFARMIREGGRFYREDYDPRKQPK